MAKAKKSEKNPRLTRQQEAAANRKRKFRVVDLEEILDKIDHIRGTIAATAESMQSAGIAELEIDGATKANRALQELLTFTVNAKAAFELAKGWPDKS